MKFKEPFPPRFRTVEHSNAWLAGKEPPIPPHIEVNGKVILNPEWENGRYEMEYIWHDKTVKVGE